MTEFILSIMAVLKRERPRPPLNPLDRLFWNTLRHMWSRWTDVLIIVKPETVISWHRAGFRFYWRWRYRSCGGRLKIRDEIRGLIRRLAVENPHLGCTQNRWRTAEVVLRRFGTKRCAIFSADSSPRGQWTPMGLPSRKIIGR